MKLGAIYSLQPFFYFVHSSTGIFLALTGIPAFLGLIYSGRLVQVWLAEDLDGKIDSLQGQIQ